jgi:hypothetical protein
MLRNRKPHKCSPPLLHRLGRTLLTHNTVYQSVEDRDLDLRSGMEESAGDSMDRLEELLARLAPVGR